MSWRTDKSKVNSPAKRRWLRYSLRTLILLTTAVGIFLGLTVVPAQQQARIVEIVRDRLGVVQYDYQYHAPDRVLRAGWLTKLLGVDFFYNVKSVSWKGIPAGIRERDELRKIMQDVCELGKLRELIVRQGSLRDIDLVSLFRLRSLEALDLTENEITDEGLIQISRLTQLKSLKLSKNHLSGTGFKYLSKLKSLESLEVDDNPITDDGVDTIANLPALKRISIRHTDVTDGCVYALAKMPRGCVISISATPITAATIQGMTEVGAHKLELLKGQSYISIEHLPPPVTASPMDAESPLNQNPSSTARLE